MRAVVTVWVLLGLLAATVAGAPAGHGEAAVPREASSPAVREASSPAVRPVPGAVVRAFEPPEHRYGPGHRGVALAAAPGEVVRAALPGTVHFAGEVARRGWVTLDHGGGLHTTYGWVTDRRVARGGRVGAGDVLGRLDAAAGHLHWGARLHGDYLDPLLLLGRWEVRLVPWK